MITNLCLNDIGHQLLLSEDLNLQDACFYARAKINNEIYTSKAYKTNNYTVQININSQSIVYGSIQFYFERQKELYFVLQCFSVDHTKIFYHRESKSQVKHIIPIIESNKYKLIKLKSIKFMFLLIRIENYICKQPNNLRKNM